MSPQCFRTGACGSDEALASGLLFSTRCPPRVVVLQRHLGSMKGGPPKASSETLGMGGQEIPIGGQEAPISGPDSALTAWAAVGVPG